MERRTFMKTGVLAGTGLMTFNIASGKNQESVKKSVLEYQIKGENLRILSVANLRVARSDKHFILKTGAGFFEGLGSAALSRTDQSVMAIYKFPQGLETRITWENTDFGVARREDVIINRSLHPVVIYGYSALTHLWGVYRLYTQANFWTLENQGKWETLTHGGRELMTRGARPCLGVTPYLALHDTESNLAMATHLLQNGDWFLRVETNENPADPAITLSTGPAYDSLAYTLAPGEEVLASHVLFQSLPKTEPESGAAPLHRWLINDAGKQTKTIPVEFNTWFYDFENLNEKELSLELDAAAALGCEAFTIDAGWYGQSEGGWATQVGDWREKTNGAFYGNMRAFADKVRKKGLVFGIWIEPERFGKNTPVVKEHPEWFYPDGGGFYCPDLDNKDVAAYIYDLIAEVIDRYGAGWVKIDFNHALGRDPHGKAHMGYTRQFWKIIDRLRKRYPKIIIENCASGGFRVDIESQKHFDTSFISDNVNLYDMLRIAEGAALRVLPGRTMRWCCFRNAGLIPKYGNKSESAIVTPKGALWNEAERIDVDFALKVSLQGHLSFSGELAALDDNTKEKIKKAVTFTKRYQRHIQNGVTHLLTPVKNIDDRTGWSAAFIHDESTDVGILYAYRLDSPGKTIALRLPLHGSKTYRLRDYDTGETVMMNTETLRDEGVAVLLNEKFRASILVCEPC